MDLSCLLANRETTTNEPENMIVKRKMTREDLNVELATMKQTGRQVQVSAADLANRSKRKPQVERLVAKLILLSTLALLSSLAGAIRLQPEGKEKFYWSGEQFVITCQNNNNIKNVKIRWIGPNGLDITEDRSQRVHAESSGPHGHRLVVMNATASTDDGQYKCTIGSTDDRNPREHIEFNLRIYKTASFLDTPRHLVLPTGPQGVLTCKVEVDPNVAASTVFWFRDQKPIEHLNDSNYHSTEYTINNPTSVLTISPLTRQHDGIYSCRVLVESSKLSKISEHEIHLETNYGPSFQEESQIVWVERSSSLANRQHNQGNLYGHSTGPARSNYPPSSHSGRARHNKQHYPNQMSSSGSSIAMQPNWRPTSEDDSVQKGLDGNSSSPQMIRVELRCTCQANPPASILWTAQNSMYVVSKGQPNHVAEEPRIETDGHNTTSILTIEYNLDVEWRHRHDSYICSASNRLGKASKKFTIEQGDPPPAFTVGQEKQYNPETTLFQFILLGANSNEQTSTTSQQPLEIVPPVDLLRIRAESATVGESKPSYWSTSKRSNEHSVQWSPSQYSNNVGDLTTSRATPFKLPQNYTVSLGRLPAGSQRLYLEAHNAVGWSPSSTYLGEYYIVSGSNSVFVNFSLTLSVLGSILISYLSVIKRCYFA